MALRLGVFVMPEDTLADPAGLTRFGRTMEELGFAAI